MADGDGQGGESHENGGDWVAPTDGENNDADRHQGQGEGGQDYGHDEAAETEGHVDEHPEGDSLPAEDDEASIRNQDGPVEAVESKTSEVVDREAAIQTVEQIMEVRAELEGLEKIRDLVRKYPLAVEAIGNVIRSVDAELDELQGPIEPQWEDWTAGDATTSENLSETQQEQVLMEAIGFLERSLSNPDDNERNRIRQQLVSAREDLATYRYHRGLLDRKPPTTGEAKTEE